MGRVWLAGLLMAEAVAAGAQTPQPKFVSKILTKANPLAEVDINIQGARRLYLVVRDGGDGYGCDWADWGSPRLIGPAGEKRLTSLRWRSAQADWGQVRINKNADGGPLRSAGRPIEYGIGTHANSLVVFDLPEGDWSRFRAQVGLDDGGTDQASCGESASVQFLVYTEQPPEWLLRGSGPSRQPGDALGTMDVAAGLEATLFASEPFLLNPTNIDIDARGRVWVCEVVNYRNAANPNNPVRTEGDRILILEDTDGDGVADRKNVYYQGRDVDAALGICLVGNRVIVTCSPNVWVFTDVDGDDKPDRKEALFTKTGQQQNDHAAHTFVFGPDGKLYWNFGNAGGAVHDRAGRPVVDLAGNTVADNGKPYFGGMAFRCHLDGSDFEVLGHNFRNNYELAVDSFGTVWQSDNDDDGNRGVRLNYLMEYGNYGYLEEKTGAGWRTPYTGAHPDSSIRHWHQTDPGVVPNLLGTGNGSPAGLCVYEGRLLPEVYWDQIVHCDAGPNVVRAYPVTQAGAGYRATIVDILQASRDNWFRPIDVCVAPDGSLFVSDWYDPGVGGNRMGDVERGRIFRIAPLKTPYHVPAFDFRTAAGAVGALANPNLAVRTQAWLALNAMGVKAEPELKRLFQTADNPRLRARALWLLSKLPDRGRDTIDRALGDPNSDLRIAALRAGRQIQLDPVALARRLAADTDPQVRRECAIALRRQPAAEAKRVWAELAARHDGKDRWYLEALGIGADGQWDDFLAAWLEKVGGQWNTPAGRDILWRSRAKATAGYLVRILRDPGPLDGRPARYLRAFDFLDGPEKSAALSELASTTDSAASPRNRFIALEAFARLEAATVARDAKLQAALRRLLDASAGTETFVELVQRFSLAERYADLVTLARQRPAEAVGIEAARVLLEKQQLELVARSLQSKEIEAATGLVQALGNTGDARAAGILRQLAGDTNRTMELRQQAVRGLAKTRPGALQLVQLARRKSLEEPLLFAAGAALSAASWDDVREQARQLFPLPPARGNQPVPPIAQLLSMRGSAVNGKVVFETKGTCSTCHVVNGQGKEVGPSLSEVGGKLSRDALFESILFPSAGISHNYESWIVALEDGNILTGIVTSETAGRVALKLADATVRTLETSAIVKRKQSNVSLMPADVHKDMTAQDIVDVVEYLTTLRAASQ